MFPQVADKSSPAGLAPFFATNTDDLLSSAGLTGLKPTKWIGKANKGGCKLWFDCGSSKDKPSCQAAGGMCVWQKFACVQSPAMLEAIDAWFD